MARAHRALDAGKREVNSFARLRRAISGSFDLLPALFQRCFNVGFKFVKFLPNDRFQRGWRRLQPVIRDLRKDSGFSSRPMYDEGSPAFGVWGMLRGLIVESLPNLGETSAHFYGCGVAQFGERFFGDRFLGHITRAKSEKTRPAR